MSSMSAIPLIVAASAVVLPILADSATKGALLLLLATATTCAFRRGSASFRHLAWLLAFTCLLLLPVMSLLLPSWRVLPAWLDTAAWVGPEVVAIDRGNRQRRDPLVGGSPRAAPHQHTAVPTVDLRRNDDHQEPVGSASRQIESHSARAEDPQTTSHGPGLALICWATGVIVLGLRLMISHRILSRIARTAPRISRGTLYNELEALRRQLGICRRVQLLVSHRRDMPMTWGLIRPRLLLPVEAETWNASRLRAVLLHELAHVKRRDSILQLVVEMVCTLYWFNPLVWFAAWRARVERERACDDSVLSNGMRPSEYAEQLLGIATSCTGRSYGVALAVAMTRRFRLERRIMAVLDNSVNRQVPSLSATGICVLVLSALVLPLTMMHGAGVTPIPQGPRESREAATLSDEVDGIANERSQHEGVIRGKLIDSVTGAPITGADVGIGDFGDAGGSNFARFQDQGLFAETKTDLEGRFVLENVAVGVQHPVIATHSDFVRHVSQVTITPPESTAEVSIKMLRGAELTVRLEAEPRPLPMYRIRIESLGGDRFIPPDRNPHLSAFASTSWTVTATEGKFRFYSLAPGAYRVDVFGVKMAGPGDQPIVEQLAFFGGADRVQLSTGSKNELVVERADYGTDITVRTVVAESLTHGIPEGHRDHMRLMLLLHRDPGVLAWNDDKWHHPEDERLGRLSLPALMMLPVAAGEPLSIRNLPPGEYAVIALTAPLVTTEGRRLVLDQGQQVDMEIRVEGPREVAQAKLHPFQREVALPAGSYSGQQLAKAINAVTGSLALHADSGIASRTVELTGGTRSVWEILEEANRLVGWRVEETGPNELTLVPRD